MSADKRYNTRKPPAKVRKQIVPEFMKEQAGSGCEGLGATDAAWLGEKGDVDIDALLVERGYDPLSPLDYILLGLIRGNGKGEESGSRLTEARRAVGAGKTQDPRNKNDYRILLDMGVHYLELLQHRPVSKIQLQPLALRCLRRDREAGRPLEGGTENSQVRRLCAKFKGDKDLILARVTMDKAPERIHTLRKICSILKAMKALGISVEWDHVIPFAVPEGSQASK